jgi:hypothetical protein
MCIVDDYFRVGLSKLHDGDVSRAMMDDGLEGWF